MNFKFLIGLLEGSNTKILAYFQLHSLRLPTVRYAVSTINLLRELKYEFPLPNPDLSPPYSSIMRIE
jgi:hypothetical protein